MFVLVSSLGALQGLFLALLLITTGKASRRANVYLAAFILSCSLLNVQDALDASGLVLRFQFLAYLFDAFIFLLGPAIYLYVRAVVSRPERRGSIILLHALPAILLFALLRLALWVATPDQRLHMILSDSHQGTNAGDPSILVAALQILAYWIAGLAELRRYVERLKGSYSVMEHMSYRWLRILLICLSALFVCWVAGVFSGVLFWQHLSTIGFSILVYLLGYVGLRQPQVFLEPPTLQPSAPQSAAESPTETEVRSPALVSSPSDVESEAGKYAKSGLRAELAASYLARLERLILERKPHMEPSLTLSDLARLVRISPHHLSQMINQYRGETFFDFINRLRVEEVQRRLSDPAFDRTNILGIALDCGFSSKGGFNAAFKKHSGTTPSHYRKSRLIVPGLSNSGEKVLSDRE